MSLSPAEEAIVRDLIAQNAALLSLASSESTIISKLGATKTTLSALTAASSLADSDLMLVRQGVTDKSVTGAALKTFTATPIEGTIQGAFKNLKLSATGTSAPVTVTADAIVVSTGSAYKTLTSVSLSPTLAASGANGLDTGTSAINTWYSVWVIWNGTTTAGLLSLSETSPTMPATYTHKARVGWIRSDSTGNKYPLGFVQYGAKVQYAALAGTNVAQHPIASSGAVNANVSLANFVPPTAGYVDVAPVSSGASNITIGIGSTASASEGYTLFWSASSATFSQQRASMAIIQSPRAIYINAQASTTAHVVGWEDNL